MSQPTCDQRLVRASRCWAARVESALPLSRTPTTTPAHHPAFHRQAPLVFVGGEVFQRRQQKRAKPTARRVGLAKHPLLFFEEARKERLGQILRGVWAVSSAAKVGVEGVPVGLAQASERLVGSGGDISRCGQN